MAARPAHLSAPPPVRSAWRLRCAPRGASAPRTCPSQRGFRAIARQRCKRSCAAPSTRSISRSLPQFELMGPFKTYPQNLWAAAPGNPPARALTYGHGARIVIAAGICYAPATITLRRHETATAPAGAMVFSGNLVVRPAHPVRGGAQCAHGVSQ
jgi:hypothetical protein